MGLGGENMEVLGTIGVFFAGLGLLFISFGLFWFVSLYEKAKGLKEKEKK